METKVGKVLVFNSSSVWSILFEFLFFLGGKGKWEEEWQHFFLFWQDRYQISMRTQDELLIRQEHVSLKRALETWGKHQTDEIHTRHFIDRYFCASFVELLCDLPSSLRANLHHVLKKPFDLHSTTGWKHCFRTTLTNPKCKFLNVQQKIHLFCRTSFFPFSISICLMTTSNGFVTRWFLSLSAGRSGLAACRCAEHFLTAKLLAVKLQTGLSPKLSVGNVWWLSLSALEMLLWE